MTQRSWAQLEAELDRWRAEGRRLRLWLRDDDAVAPSAALDRLVATLERHRAPLLLAAIPLAADEALAACAADVPWLRPCQHGARHRNHAPPGRKKSEFGPGRPPGEALADIAAGRERMAALFGSSALPVFVPPWNRIDPAIAAALPGLGFSGLSCFRGYAIAGAPELCLVNSDLDVMDWHRGRVGRSVEDLNAELLAHLAARRATDGGEPTLGVLLHHLVHDEAAWTFLETMLAMVSGHPAVTLCDPAALFTPGT